MEVIEILLLVVAAVAFLLAAARVVLRVELVGLGLFLLTVYLLVPHITAH